MKLIIKREGDLQDIPFGTGDMSRFLEEWLRTEKCGLDGVVGRCSTLHQQGCSLTGLHDLLESGNKEGLLALHVSLHARKTLNRKPNVLK